MDSKLNKLYSLEFEWGLNFSFSDLYDIGISVEDILDFIKKGYIIRVKKNIYKYDFYKLYEYANLCIEEKDYDMAINCLNICLFIQHKNKEFLRNLFYLYLKKKDISSGVSYFYRIIDDKESLDNNDILILYLLSNLVILPDKFNNYIININKEELINNISIEEYDKELLISLINLVKNSKYENDNLTLSLIKNN